jgi:hypothetical protein
VAVAVPFLLAAVQARLVRRSAAAAAISGA